MSADVRRWRARRGLTQVEAAEELGVSQTYLSLLEAGLRPMPEAIARSLRGGGEPVEDQLRKQLSALGYPGFRHLHAALRLPLAGAVLERALRQTNLDARVTEALPWVVREYDAAVDWEWLVRQAKLHDFQNRLGFLLELAGNDNKVAGDAKQALEKSRLLAEATFCWDSMPSETRAWIRGNRTAAAAHWNVVSRLRTEDLRYAE